MHLVSQKTLNFMQRLGVTISPAGEHKDAFAQLSSYFQEQTPA